MRRSRYRTSNFIVGAGFKNDEANPKSAGRVLRVLNYILRKARVVWIHQQGHLGGAGDQLMQQLKSLSDGLGAECGNPGDVSTRPTDARHKPGMDWIGGGVKHDWNRLGRRYCGPDSDIAGANNKDRDLAADEVVCQSRQPVELTIRPSIFDRDVSALHETHFAEAAAEGRHAGRPSWCRYAVQ
jgi:hypothetical protein